MVAVERSTSSTPRDPPSFKSEPPEPSTTVQVGDRVLREIFMVVEWLSRAPLHRQRCFLHTARGVHCAHVCTSQDEAPPVAKGGLQAPDHNQQRARGDISNAELAPELEPIDDGACV